MFDDEVTRWTWSYEIDSKYLSFDEAIWVNTHLWDMHSGNYGFNDEGDPIIIDYACVRMMDGDIIRG